MSDTIQDGERSLRLNPFAFPSDTDFRFVLLIVAVIGASLFIYNAIFLSVDRSHYLSTVTNCLESYAPDNQLASQDPEALAAFLIERRATQLAFEKCRASAEQAIAVRSVVGSVLLLAVAVAIFWFLPKWKIHQNQFASISMEDAPEVVVYLDQLSHEAGITPTPSFLWNPLNPTSSAIAFGRSRQYFVGIFGGLVMKFYTDRPEFRAVLLHELAHIRNSDIGKTYFAVAVWQAFVVVGLLPFAVSLIGESSDYVFQMGLRVLVLTLIVFLIRNSVLRTREIYADVRASIWDGSAGALRGILGAMPNPRESRWRRFLNLHPEPGERWRALDDTTPLFHLGFLVVFGTGFVAMVAAPNVNTVLRSLLTGLPITVLEVLSGALIFALLAAGVVGLGSWRATFAELSQGGHWRTTGWLGIGLGLGMILGQIFSFTGYFDLAIQESEPLSQIVTFELLWGLLLTAGLVVFLWWVEAGASTWLEVAAADRSVRSYYTIATVIATVWLAVWLGLLLFVHGLGSLGPQWLMFSPLGMWAIIQNPITTLLVISLWAVPLAAWFWRRRMRSVNEAGWAYLDSAPQLSPLSLQASLRPRLSFVVGLAGGAVYCVLLAIIRAALRLVVPEAQRGTEEFILLFVSASITLAALLQAGVATVVAARVRRLGWVHGLFAAFVAGFTMTLGFLGLNLMFGGNVNGALFWNVFSQIVNGGALLALPCALTASAVSDRLRRSHARSMEKATVSLKA